jgi:ParB-like chromosome segregation protein Spo0J
LSRTVLQVDSLPTVQIPVSQIHPNDFNPSPRDPRIVEILRKDLREHGPHAFGPVLVRPCKCKKIRGKHYELNDGEKRWIAKRLEREKTMGSQIQPMDDAESRSLCYRRAREHGTVDEFREADLFQWESQHGRTYREIASQYVVTEPFVKNRMTLLKISPRIRRMVPHGTFSASMWEVVAQGVDADIMESMVNDIHSGKAKTVYEAQNRVKWYNESRIPTVKQKEREADAKEEDEANRKRQKSFDLIDAMNEAKKVFGNASPEAEISPSVESPGFVYGEPIDSIQIHDLSQPQGRLLTVPCPNCKTQIVLVLKALEGDTETIEVYVKKPES